MAEHENPTHSGLTRRLRSYISPEKPDDLRVSRIRRVPNLCA